MPYESLPVVRAVKGVLERSISADEAVTGVLEAIGDSMGWLVGGFWIPEADGGWLRVRCLWAARIHKGTSFAEQTRQMRLPPGVGLPGRVWARQEAVWVEDVGTDPDFPGAAAVRIDGLHAAVGFPVQHEGRMLGVLEFFSDVLRAPVEALLPVFDAIGREIGAFVARQPAWEPAPADPADPAADPVDEADPAGEADSVDPVDDADAPGEADARDGVDAARDAGEPDGTGRTEDA
jgi:hypothetical protein